MITYIFSSSWGDYPSKIEFDFPSKPTQITDSRTTIKFLNAQLSKNRHALNQAKDQLLAEVSRTDPDSVKLIELQMKINETEAICGSIVQRIRDIEEE